MARPSANLIDHLIARSVDAPRSLLPWLPTLFRDCPSLGSTPRSTCTLLMKFGLKRKHRVLDLACGKGSGGIELARRIGCRVVGVDAYGPFIASARQTALRKGVGELCRYQCGDVERFSARPADAAIMLGLFPHERAAPMLRRLTRRGGLYVVDDALPAPPGLRAALDEAKRFFESFGDGVVWGKAMPRSAIARLNASLYRRIARRSAEVGKANPGLRPALREFLANQRHANRQLLTAFRPVLWIVRRGD